MSQMDKNKLKVLQDIDYKINRCCGVCKHGDFGYLNDWGTCSIQQYSHLKHSGENRQLSINVFGSCDKFELNETYDFGGFKEFVK